MIYGFLPLPEATGLLRGERWIAAAEEFPPQKLRRDTRAGLANSGVLLLAGAPIAGAGILRAIEEWIWPVGNPTWSFKWPFEQNALTTVVFRRYPRRYTLLKPGCPLNSPFGALLRHLVGGTPHRAVYHPDHRTAWLAEALRCTIRALNRSADSRAPLERCTPNEERFEVDSHGCGEGDKNSLHTTPLSPTVLGRLRAADAEACCGLCNADEACAGWTFLWKWPASALNCVLLEAFEGVTHYEGRVTRAKVPRTGGGAGATGAAGAAQQTRTYIVPPPLFGVTGPS